MQDRKPMFFYSNYCTFSKQAIDVMQRNGLTGKFTLVCIERRNGPLPPMVDRVPVIVGPNFVFKDDALFDHLDSLSRRGSGQAHGGAPGPAEISAFQFTSMNSDTFHPSFQDDREQDITMMSPNQIIRGNMLVRSTGMNDAFTDPAMHDVSKLDGDVGLGHIQDGTIERVMAQRDADIAAVFGSQRM